MSHRKHRKLPAGLADARLAGVVVAEYTPFNFKRKSKKSRRANVLAWRLARRESNQ